MMDHEVTENHEIERWSGLKVWAYSLIQGKHKTNNALVDYAGVGPGDRVLDVGCGPGAALEGAIDAGADEVSGVDPSPAMVKRAAKRVPKATVKEASAESLPFEDNSFTAVWTIAAFHHWADRSGGLAEMLRVLEPGGAFYVVERELKPGDTGHGLSRKEGQQMASRITEDHGVPARVDTLKAGRHTFVVVTGSR
jgi:ubiquinone/menaquinone biosynthesis C-methylase UbiE